MESVFEYDVFISFASADEDLVRPIWQELSLGGLRVFWSDETLKQNVGQSFFSVIQNALVRSKHFVLICTRNSMQSEWVRLEYQTFYSECFIKNQSTRRLIVFPIEKVDPSLIPAFLKNLQIASSINEILPILGGVDIQALRSENEKLKYELSSAQKKIDELQVPRKEYQKSKKELNSLGEQNEALKDELNNRNDNSILSHGEIKLIQEQNEKLGKIIERYKEAERTQKFSQGQITWEQALEQMGQTIESFKPLLLKVTIKTRLERLAIGALGVIIFLLIPLIRGFSKDFDLFMVNFSDVLFILLFLLFLLAVYQLFMIIVITIKRLKEKFKVHGWSKCQELCKLFLKF